MFHSTHFARILTTLLTAVLLVGGVSSAHALTLLYTGPVFNEFGSGFPTLPGQVEATITLDSSITTLTNGLNLTDLDVTSFSLSALGRTIDSGNALNSLFDLTIGPSVLPEIWLFAVVADLAEGAPLPFGEMIFSEFNSLFADGYLVDVDVNDFPSPFSAITGAVSIDTFVSPGVWSVQQTPSSGANPVPEPSTMMLFGSGLGGIIGWRMKTAQA